jgi:heme exporter protein CcmD
MDVPHMDMLANFLHMGGYGDFVWGAYACAAGGLIGALAVSWRGLKARERAFEALKRARREA